MSSLDVSFDNWDGIRWETDLLSTWDLAKSQLDVVETVPWRGDWKLRCQLTIHDVFGSLPALLRNGAELVEQTENISGELRKGRLLVHTPKFLDQLEWFPKIRKSGFRLELRIHRLENVLSPNTALLRIVTLGTFQPPDHMHVRDVKVWDAIGPSAGLPSLGKRK